jgi:hypothetical protein
MTRDAGEVTLNKIVKRELGGADQPFNWRGDPAMPPTPERIRKISVELSRMAAHLASPHAIVPRIEELAKSKERKGKDPEPPRITPNMRTAIQYYAVVSFVADGPSIGVGRYGDGGGSAPSWGKSITSDERLQARRIFDAARMAAFGVKDRSGRWVCDEAARQALEPVLLGDDQAWSMNKIGAFLSTYRSETSAASAAGTQEIVQVARRLRLFFRLGDD